MPAHAYKTIAQILGEPRPGLITKGRDKIGFSPLPRCTYLNTDLYGDDVGDGKGISTGSATGCKVQCAKPPSPPLFKDGPQKATLLIFFLITHTIKPFIKTSKFLNY